MVELMGCKSVVIPSTTLGALERIVNKLPMSSSCQSTSIGDSAEPLLELLQVRPASKVDFDALQVDNVLMRAQPKYISSGILPIRASLILPAAYLLLYCRTVHKTSGSDTLQFAG